MRERTPFPASLLSSLPNLKLLLTTGPRNASLDLHAATAQGIIIAGTLGKGVPARRRDQGGAENVAAETRLRFQATAQHTWSLILALTSRIAVDSQALQLQLKEPLSEDASVKGYGPWESGFAVNLAGKTLGLVGLGKLGAQTARTGVLGFGMKVIAWSENLTQEKADATAKEFGLQAGVFKVVGKEEVFRKADVVSLHYVLSPRSIGMVGEKELAWMKKSVFLINTSRGPLIDEQALYQCLVEGRIRGAGLDVFWGEPLEERSKWRTTEWGKEGRSELVLSPHMGYVDETVLRRWYEEQAENIERWIRGEEVLYRLN